MKPTDPRILTINGGSSSIKFALYQIGEPLERGLYGKVDRIGLSGTNLTFTDADGKPQPNLSITASDHKSAADFLIDWLEKRTGFESVRAVGHRVVHGMKHTAPEVVTQELLDELHRIQPFAAALGGLDTLVFAGGVGENAPLVRSRICEGLGFLGIELNEARNAETAAVISEDASRVTIRVIPTDEELTIARSVSRVLSL